ELFVLGVRRAGRLCGVAPLFLMKDRYLGYPVTIAGFLGQGMSDYSDFIVGKGEDRDEVLGSIVRHLSARSGCWDVMDLRNFFGESGNVPAFRKCLDRMGWDQRLDPESFCRFVRIRGDWDSYYKSCYSGDHRKNHRKEWKRWISAAGGNVRFIESTEDPQGLIEQLAEIETHHPMAGSGRPGFFCKNPFQGFFGDFLRAAAQRGWLNVVLMEGDGLPVAFTLSFRHNGRFYLYLTSYRKEFQKFGIGRLTCLRMMERYWLSGEGEIDFLLGEEEYKEKWAPEGRRNLRILASHATPRSRAARWLWGKCLPSVERRVPRVHRVLVASNEVGWTEVLKRISRRLGSRGKDGDSIPRTGE
ncbi:MAG: GNAT family N-acetyltransferase, partial [Candidatus Deferrimicrobium sp.]